MEKVEKESWVPKSVILFVDQHAERLRLNPDLSGDQLYRFLMRLRNGSPDAILQAEMFDRGEISWNQMLEK